MQKFNLFLKNKKELRYWKVLMRCLVVTDLKYCEI